MPIQIVGPGAEIPAGAVVVEFLSHEFNVEAFLQDIRVELRRKERRPLFIYDADLLSLEDQYALARVLSACPNDRTAILHAAWPDSLCDVLTGVS